MDQTFFQPSWIRSPYFFSSMPIPFELHNGWASRTKCTFPKILCFREWEVKKLWVFVKFPLFQTIFWIKKWTFCFHFFLFYKTKQIRFFSKPFMSAASAFIPSALVCGEKWSSKINMAIKNSFKVKKQHNF